jgi:hypothetical protein
MYQNPVTLGLAAGALTLEQLPGTIALETGRVLIWKKIRRDESSKDRLSSVRGAHPSKTAQGGAASIGSGSKNQRWASAEAALAIAGSGIVGSDNANIKSEN